MGEEQQGQGPAPGKMDGGEAEEDRQSGGEPAGREHQRDQEEGEEEEQSETPAMAQIAGKPAFAHHPRRAERARGQSPRQGPAGQPRHEGRMVEEHDAARHRRALRRPAGDGEGRGAAFGLQRTSLDGEAVNGGALPGGADIAGAVGLRIERLEAGAVEHQPRGDQRLRFTVPPIRCRRPAQAALRRGRAKGRKPPPARGRDSRKAPSTSDPDLKNEKRRRQNRRP